MKKAALIPIEEIINALTDNSSYFEYSKAGKATNTLMSSADKFAPTKVIFVRVNWNELGLERARFLLLIC